MMTDKKTKTKVIDVKNGAELPSPIYENKPYIVLSKKNEEIVLVAGDMDEIKSCWKYYDDCVVEVREHDLQSCDNTKLQQEKVLAPSMEATLGERIEEIVSNACDTYEQMRKQPEMREHAHSVTVDIYNEAFIYEQAYKRVKAYVDQREGEDGEKEISRILNTGAIKALNRIAKIVTTPEYWDCECEEDYVHRKDVDACFKCGALRKDQPDSRANEVLEAGFAIDETEEKEPQD